MLYRCYDVEVDHSYPYTKYLYINYLDCSLGACMQSEYDMGENVKMF